MGQITTSGLGHISMQHHRRFGAQPKKGISVHPAQMRLLLVIILVEDLAAKFFGGK